MPINPDDYFRHDSGAYRVAVKLLSGKPATRQDLVADSGVSITTVNRVVEKLEEAGATIVRTVDGKQAIFQVVELGAPRKRNAYPELDAAGTIVKDELFGRDHRVEFTLEQGTRYSGILEGLSNVLPPVGTKVSVAGIERGAHDQPIIKLAAKNGKKIVLSSVQNVTKTT